MEGCGVGDGTGRVVCPGTMSIVLDELDW
jgi:hypothetical protein